MMSLTTECRASQWQTQLAIACCSQDGEAAQRLGEQFAGLQRSGKPLASAQCGTPLNEAEFLRQLNG